jgi:aminopeptidase YwaD
MTKNLAFIIVTAVFSVTTCFSQDISRVRFYLDTLCSPAMHGRGACFDGDKAAASFIKSEFEKCGLKPIRNNYFQPFQYDVNCFEGRVELKADKKNLLPGKDFIANCISKGGHGSARALYLDTMVFYDENARSSFLSKKTKNKAVIYDVKFYNKLIEYPEVLDKIHEGKCIIELHDKKLTASLSQKQFSNPFFQVAQSAFPDSVYKVKFRLDATLKKNYTSQNVIGYIEGATQPDSVIVISAHYDHLGTMGKNVYFPGANDNASGVSMLLELAHFYSQKEHVPDYTMVFMAFGAEEIGLIGSRYFTENPLFSLKKIKFMINLDLLGTGDEGMMVVNATIHPAEYNKLLEINETLDLLPAIKRRGPAANSDHFFFSEKGVPAFFFYTLGGISAYHDVMDRPDTLPLTRFKEVFSLITNFVKRL